LRRTTKGWHLCCQCKDGTTEWRRLVELKEAYPIQTAEYAVANKIDHEPAFSWWVPYTLKKRNRILNAVKKRYFRTFQKYGIELPKTVERALEIDKENGNTLWQDALAKEMKAVGKAFDFLNDGDPDPVGHKKISVHIVMDIKQDFTRKCRLVADGHKTDLPSSITYTSIVSRESVRLAFMIAALNGLDVQSADIGNAYLNAPCKEKVYIVCGPEFGAMKGRRARIVRALYGLKSSAAAWRSWISQFLHDEEFRPCKADNDVWMRPAEKADGFQYYEYVLVYTDNILCLSTDPGSILNKMDQRFLLKPDSIGSPTRYLGASVKKFQKEDGEWCWAMGSEQYVKEAVRNVSNWLSLRGLKLKSRAPSVLPMNYRPELDTSPLCDDDLTNYYMQQIGILRWMVELGRIDIATEASIMASYSAAPRTGHFDAVMHMFAYLNQHERSTMVFDPDYVDYKVKPKPDWSEFYRDTIIEHPPDAPTPRGNPVQVTGFVDSDHAGDKVTRKSRSGILVYANKAPIVWLSKKQVLH